MASIFGRAIVVVKTNKSGGSLAKGDVVIVDSSNDNAVTTTTSGGTTITVGVVIEENGIASNASGRVQFGGHVGLVNVNASVTRGHYGYTHTVAKQAADAGASRIVGTFCLFTTGGTTPEADLFSQPDGSSATGNVATDAIWDAAGDLVQGTGANTAAKLTLGAAGTVVRSTGSTNAYAFPPGYEFDYVEITSSVSSITATTEGTANTVVTANAVSYDGSTVIILEFFCPIVITDSGAASRVVTFYLYDGSGSTGYIGQIMTPAASAMRAPVMLRRRFTPSNASHTYSVRASVDAGTGQALAGAGGSSGSGTPTYIRQVKV